MANKTLRFYGNGYAPAGESATVVVTFNGNTVYTGPVATVSEAENLTFPSDQEVLFSFEVDEALYGNFPMTIEVTGGDRVVTSYAESNNAKNVKDQADPTLWYKLCATDLSDYRTNVELDGVALSKGALGDVLTGAWSWETPNGSTLTADVALITWDEAKLLGVPA